MVEIASLPDSIRGYEERKLRSARAARTRAEGLMARLQDARVSPAPRA